MSSALPPIHGACQPHRAHTWQPQFGKLPSAELCQVGQRTSERTAVKHSDSRSADLAIKSHHRFISKKEHHMTTQQHQVITKILVGGAVALGFYVGGAAPAGADPNSAGSAPNLFGGLTCSCRQTAPPGSPAAGEEIERGLREGRPAWLSGRRPSTWSTRSAPSATSSNPMSTARHATCSPAPRRSPSKSCANSDARAWESSSRIPLV